MKDDIEAKLREGQFSKLSEDIRSLILNEQNMTGRPGLAVLVGRGMTPAGLSSERNRGQEQAFTVNSGSPVIQIDLGRGQA